ncbi:hypothetical protein SCOR_22635 [Sulfidibacter corallicola]
MVIAWATPDIHGVKFPSWPATADGWRTVPRANDAVGARLCRRWCHRTSRSGFRLTRDRLYRGLSFELPTWINGVLPCDGIENGIFFLGCLLRRRSVPEAEIHLFGLISTGAREGGRRRSGRWGDGGPRAATEMRMTGSGSVTRREARNWGRALSRSSGPAWRRGVNPVLIRRRSASMA